MAINNWRSFSSSADALNALWNILATWYASWDDALNDVINIVNSWNTTNDYPHTEIIPWKFSTSDSLKYQWQGYQNDGNDTLANAYKDLWTGSSQYDNVANQINSFYNALYNDVNSRENQLGSAKSQLANQLNEGIARDYDYVMWMFWPEWTLTNEVNKYYTDMWNYLATEAGREAANIAAQWVHSGASLWAIRAQQNEAYNNAYSRYLQAKEQEINAKQQIASNLINYMSTLRKEYWDTTNQYIISQYERANDLLNSIATDLTKQYVSLAWARIQTWSGSWGSSANAINSLLDRIASTQWQSTEDNEYVTETDWAEWSSTKTYWTASKNKPKTNAYGWIGLWDVFNFVNTVVPNIPYRSAKTIYNNITKNNGNS